MATNGRTTHEHASQSVAWSHAPVDLEGLAQTLLDFCAQSAVLFAMWFLL
jgi:hypothetical protein